MIEETKKPGEIEPIHVALMWNLLFTGDEPKLSDLKPRITPVARRDRLREFGLLEYRQKTDETGRASRAMHVFLTDKGWQWAADNLDATFSPQAKIQPALAGLLKRLKGYMRANNVSLAEILSAEGSNIQSPVPEKEVAVPAAQTADLETRIRDAHAVLSKGGWNARVRLADLRPRLADVPREIQDATLLRMQAEGKLVLYHNDNPVEMRPEDHEAALDLLGEKRHLLYMRG